MAATGQAPTEEIINDNPSQTEEVINNNQSPIGEVINNNPFQKTQGAVSTYDYIQDDVLYINEKMKTVMVSSGEQLNSLYDLNMGQLYPPGTIAYTPGFTNMWQLSMSGKWVSMLSGENSGSGGSDSSMDNNAKKYIEYFVKMITREITKIDDDQGLITSIGEGAFVGCTSLTTVSFPKAISVGNYAFGGCTSLTTVSFSKATSIDEEAFDGCTSLTTVSFPKAISIGWGAFGACTSLTTVLFPEVTSIGGGVFGGCTSLTAVLFPEVTNIGQGAFNDCTSLTTVSFSKATSIDEGAFYGCNNMTDLYLPNAENTYTNSNKWFSQGMNVTVHYNTSFDADGNPIINSEQEGE